MLWIKYSVVIAGAVVADAIVVDGVGEDVNLKGAFIPSCLAAIPDITTGTTGDTGDSNDGERGWARRSNQCPMNTVPPQFSFEDTRARF